MRSARGGASDEKGEGSSGSGGLGKASTGIGCEAQGNRKGCRDARIEGQDATKRCQKDQ